MAKESVKYPTAQRVKLADLKRHPYAPRLRSATTVHIVSKSIREMGLLKLPTWNATTGNLLSLHSVVEALRDAGETEVLVWVVQLTEVQEAAALLMLNSHLNEWDWEHVAVELRKLKEAGVDLALSGLAESDIGPLLAADWVPADKATLDDVQSDTKQPGLFT